MDANARTAAAATSTAVTACSSPRTRPAAAGTLGCRAGDRDPAVVPLLPVDRVPAQSRPEACYAFPSEVFVQAQRDARRFKASAAPVAASSSHADEAPPWHPARGSTGDPAGVGALLYAAKPVQWRGDGEYRSQSLPMGAGSWGPKGL